MTDELSYRTLYSGGAWVASHADATIEVENPATEAVIGTVPRGDATDIACAVEHARQALPAWSATTWQDRQRYLRSLADNLRNEAERTAQTIVAELGMPIDATLAVQALEPASIIDSYASAMDLLIWEHEVAHSLIAREPVGVVGAITPWNYPLYQIACKVGAALAAGCTVVLKPSELTPFNAYIFAQAAEKAGLPPGVVNLVTGFGAEAGEALVTHPGIDMISFTGSTTVGRRVAGAAAASIIPVLLELGGKSASIILDGADLDSALAGSLRSCFRNSGQSCSAHTRLLVPRHLYSQVVDAVVDRVGSVRLGNPLDHGDHLGPVASRAQRERVRRYIDQGTASGARLVAGGPGAPDAFDRGYYVQPTVFADVDPNAVIAREEIFGPVLCILAYRDLADAVQIANATPYGLSAGVWCATESDGIDLARRLRAGEVQLNGAPFNVHAPFGGMGLSGFGRELGSYGIEAFTATKAVHRAAPATSADTLAASPT